MPGVAYLSHPSSLEHEPGPHPERRERIVAIERALEERAWPDLSHVASRPVERRTLETVHDPGHVRAIEALCARGGGAVDSDTIVSPGSWDAARHAAGAGAQLVDLLLGGTIRAGFSAHRPPGHHAERDRAMGFCLFNSVAVAARHALDAHGVRRVAILDWDVHHGNGTSEIFHTCPEVLYISIHQWPLYPGTGRASDSGSGPGEGFTVNLPIPAGAGDPLLTSMVDHVAVPLIREYAPELVLVSAGYDAHRRDPLADCAATEAGFGAMTSSLRVLASELDIGLGLLLEGGYDLRALSGSVAATLEALLGAAAPMPPDRPPDPVAARAAERLGQRWPTLAP